MPETSPPLKRYLILLINAAFNSQKSNDNKIHSMSELIFALRVFVRAWCSNKIIVGCQVCKMLRTLMVIISLSSASYNMCIKFSSHCTSLHCSLTSYFSNAIKYGGQHYIRAVHTFPK